MRTYTVSTSKKIVIAESGGFNLSDKAKMFIANVKNLDLKYPNVLRDAADFAEKNRDADPLLLCLRLLGSSESSGEGSVLKIVEVPPTIDWEIIVDKNGAEIVVEKGRYWR